MWSAWSERTARTSGSSGSRRISCPQGPAARRAGGTRGRAPYRNGLTHGFVVDGEGKKMSKSVGNVIDSQTIIDQYGAEILRLWVAAEDYTEDIRISEEILKRLVEAYRRIRNTSRFILGNLYDFDPWPGVDPGGAVGKL